MTQLKEQIKTPEKELSNEEIANLSDTQFKTLVIRMLRELLEYGKKNMERIRRLWDISKCANIWIIDMPEGEEEEQGIENLFEKRIKENLPN